MYVHPNFICDMYSINRCWTSKKNFKDKINSVQL